MRRAAAVFLVLLAACVCGCAGRAERTAETVTLEAAADYDNLWEAALAVVGRRFAVSKAEKDGGVIETEYLVGALSKTGFAANAVSPRAAAEDFFHTVRRRAVVTIDLVGAAPLAVVVETWRLVRERPQTTRGGTFSVGRPTEQGAQYRTLWLETGRDGALEKKMTAEITSLYRKRR